MDNERILGIDYGTKRIGVAISDENHKLSFPKEIILNDANIFKVLGKIIQKENIKEIVVGESLDFSGKLNKLGAKIKVFIGELKLNFNLPVHRQQEFLTSVEARRFKEGGMRKANPSEAHTRRKKTKIGHIDASAAALILQRYLDKKNNGMV